MTARTVGSLTADDLGKTVKVVSSVDSTHTYGEGVLVRIEHFDAVTHLYIDAVEELLVYSDTRCEVTP